MKAISPMIAVVLLIAFTIGIGTLVTIFATSLTTTSTGITSKSSENLTQCSLGVLEIKGAECSTKSDGLLLYLKFESVNSTNYTSDVSGNGFDGRLINYRCSPATCNITSGRYGNGLQFGTSDSNYVSLGNSQSLDPVGPFTIELWIKQEVRHGPGYIYSTGSDVAANATAIWLASATDSSNNGTVFSIRDSSGDQYSTSYTTSPSFDNYPVPVGVWHHIAGTWNGTHLLEYIDGGLNKTVTTGSVTIDRNNLNTFIGALATGPLYYFNGTIDDVRFYNRSLSSGEIMDHYGNGASLRVIISNNGPVNLGSNFTLTYVVGGTINTTSVSLSSSLASGNTALLTLQNITDSGALSQVRLISTVCPTVMTKKDVGGQIC